MPPISRELLIAGRRFTSPVLIPSVSSKGFRVTDGFSEAGPLVEMAEDALTETLLVSAYDLRHRRLAFAENYLEADHRPGLLDQLQLLIVDSGGYETGTHFEGGEVDRTERRVAPYEYADYVGVVDGLPKRPTLVVSYDGPDQAVGDYDEQVQRAQAFFAPRAVASNLLLKPPAGVAYHDPTLLVPVARRLVAFNVIGFTEKELGDTFLARMLNLAGLRRVLDEANVPAPIHVFGALDPVFTPLYFAAGGELFDGLSWLRYSYEQGLAVHPEIGSLLRRGTDDRAGLRSALRVVENLNRLRELRRQLERYAQQGDVSELGPQAEVLAETIATMHARLSKETRDGR